MASKETPTTRTRRHSSDDTRLALIRAAEQLFASKGHDAVSLREVSVTAGQSNNSAVLYHFGSRDALIDAVLERHSAPIQQRYLAQLEALERHGGLSARALVEILVLPLVARLDDDDGGFAYISLCAQLSVSPHLPLVGRSVASTPEVMRLSIAMTRYFTAPPELMLFRIERMANTMYASIVAWKRLSDVGAAAVSRAAFESDLIDGIVDMLTRPSSPATVAALEEIPSVD